ncbi:PEPxxWA-CTERM sorting domain-containing protein [Phenylobacterium sp.]|uniref:PEPxxWA-CTERM sorting domain-containing protein n=1 Tax=Phenylobacterium sp. TaxID=1871053 RepID=UPI0025EB898A|nr:PEPxxWA-CTERM sorting domain-containing protein [Phenylobacterium sp.]MBX3485639.1 PEPxxWA-CTERM sorting domain-containing protein [Phenylobacterium sp.]
MSRTRNLAVAGAALLATAAAPSHAATLVVDAAHGVAIDFDILGEGEYYRFAFGEMQFFIAGLDPGEGYRVSLYDTNGDLWAHAPDSTTVTDLFIPPKTLNGVGPVRVRATLTALGASSFTFDDSYSVSNIFGQISEPDLPRRVGNRGVNGTISGFEVAPPPVTPPVTPPTVVPEPATWALMIAGFGLAGAALRRRRSGIA